MDKNFSENFDIKELLLSHFNTYPQLQTEDIFKFIYQSAFGCEHLIENENTVLKYILNEYEAGKSNKSALTEKLGDKYSRVHLTWLNKGLSAQTLAKLFYLSSKTKAVGESLLLQMLDVTQKLIIDGKFPIRYDEFSEKLLSWKNKGYPALHHSEAFSSIYRPAYRVIADKYVINLKIFTAIDRLIKAQESVVITVEGGSASGKTTLSDILIEVYDCNVIHMDDFFLRPEQRTSGRFSEPGGNIDRERFIEEVLGSLINNEDICYRPFDCSTQTLSEKIVMPHKSLTVVEGVYSTHPGFSSYYDYSVFLDISPELQKGRILHRNSGELANRFFNEWIPLENTYFSATDIKNRVNLIIPVK